MDVTETKYRQVQAGVRRNTLPPEPLCAQFKSSLPFSFKQQGAWLTQRRP
jgi:hypothetical protein